MRGKGGPPSGAHLMKDWEYEVIAAAWMTDGAGATCGKQYSLREDSDRGLRCSPASWCCWQRMLVPKTQIFAVFIWQPYLQWFSSVCDEWRKSLGYKLMELTFTLLSPLEFHYLSKMFTGWRRVSVCVCASFCSLRNSHSSISLMASSLYPLCSFLVKLLLEGCGNC